jgi:glycosyltransferase involved in cell wall biosynthesis
MYAKGFSENGVRATVICFSNEYLDVNNGVIDGVSYYHPYQQRKRSDYFIVRRWRNLVKYFRTYSTMKQLHKQDKILAINVWTNLFLTHLFAWFLSKLFNAELITECSEHPLRFYQEGILRKKIGALKSLVESHLNDGFFCISRYLINFYKERGIDGKRLFLVPSIIDPSRFLKQVDRPLPNPYIGYFGSLTFERDSVDVLLKGFAKFNDIKPEVYLVLGGFCTDNQRKKISDLISELKLGTKVIILNHLTKEAITGYIAHACALVMVRSPDLESDASYPSKLTEFLATGKPVVSVNVGEISDYLSDGVNVFLTQPGNPDEIADKLIGVFKNYPEAKRVGEQGRVLTEGIFNYHYQAQRMIDFIKSLKYQ